MRTNAHGDTPQGSPGQQVVPNSEIHTSGGLGSALCRAVDLSSKPACPHSVCTEQSPQDTQALAAEVSSNSRDTARRPPRMGGGWGCGRMGWSPAAPSHRVRAVPGSINQPTNQFIVTSRHCPVPSSTQQGCPILQTGHEDLDQGTGPRLPAGVHMAPRVPSAVQQRGRGGSGEAQVPPPVPWAAP